MTSIKKILKPIFIERPTRRSVQVSSSTVSTSPTQTFESILQFHASSIIMNMQERQIHFIFKIVPGDVQWHYE